MYIRNYSDLNRISYIKYIVGLKQIFLYRLGKVFSKKHFNPQYVYSIVCTKNQVAFYSKTPNNIIYFNVDGNEGYFRESRVHSSKYEFVCNLIDDYCTYILNDNEVACLIRQEAKSKLKSPKNLKRFFNMGEGTNKYAPINKFRQSLDSSLIGFPGPISDGLRDVLIDFVQFSWGALSEYRYCRTDLNHYNSIRTKVTKLVADYLNVGNIIPSSEYAELVLDGKKRYGVIVGTALGVDPTKNRIDGISPIFQHDLICLQILDIVCYQKDHRPGNYFVKIDDEYRASSLSAFDNDCPTTLFPSLSIDQRTYFGTAPLFKSASLNVPYFPLELYETLKNKKINDLDVILKPYCSQLERFALIFRLCVLRRKLGRLYNSEPWHFINRNEWCDDTVKTQLSLPFKNSYLSVFVNKCIINSEA